MTYKVFIIGHNHEKYTLSVRYHWESKLDNPDLSKEVIYEGLNSSELVSRLSEIRKETSIDKKIYFTLINLSRYETNSLRDL